ncbi:MarR family winged helix-turn-helix transcriptional regulator [Streptomyces odontomachi]|uniref:MarR family winged helix-turn-helix transcriptional regulator n=1 Tax=Streptomyces odontomachi TaxID=2944940 RepID=UPI0021093503|nr:MarR family transcriptional regulator [Streptomyces sp. ODS25]
MAGRRQYEELAQQLSAIGAVKRGLARMLPPDCPSGAVAVLALLDRHGAMRMGRLAELLAVDMSVTSRHVTHCADRGWISRSPDPDDRRSRILTLTVEGTERLAELSDRYVRALARCLADWSDDDVDQLNSQLARLRVSFDDSHHPAPDPANPPDRLPEPQHTAAAPQ